MNERIFLVTWKQLSRIQGRTKHKLGLSNEPINERERNPSSQFMTYLLCLMAQSSIPKSPTESGLHEQWTWAPRRMIYQPDHQTLTGIWLISSHSVTFISLYYTWPCPVGYKVFPFYRWKKWGLKDKGDSWLEMGLQGEPIICVVSFKSSCPFFCLLFFILMIKVMFIWKNSNISGIKQGRMPKTLQV